MAGISKTRNGRGLTPQSLARAMERADHRQRLSQHHPRLYERAMGNLRRLQNEAIADDDGYRCTNLHCTGKSMTEDDLRKLELLK